MKSGWNSLRIASILVFALNCFETFGSAIREIIVKIIIRIILIIIEVYVKAQVFKLCFYIVLTWHLILVVENV